MTEMIYREPPYTEILDEGVYKDFHYEIVSYGSHPCAYVELPKGHKYHGKNEDYIPIYCHGDITYSSECGIIFPEDNPNHRDGFWIGWDYNHIGDYNAIRAKTGCGGKKWTIEEIFEDVKNVINQL